MSFKIRKVIIDVGCLSFLGLASIYSFFFMETFKRGFYCDDNSIRYPFNPSTVSTVSVTILAFVVPIIGMIIGEIFHAQKSKNLTSHSRDSKISKWIFLIYHKVGLFAFGGLVTLVMTETAKRSIGRLRPHFIQVCNPDIDCKNASNINKYHVDFKCRNETSQHWWHDSRLSFPSGHSSLIMYGMIYFALYLQLRMTWKGSKLLRHLFQGMCLWVGWFTALSRVSDYKHHWSDVLAGMILGSIVAFITVFCVADLFNERQTNDNEEETNVWDRKTCNDPCLPLPQVCNIQRPTC